MKEEYDVKSDKPEDRAFGIRAIAGAVLGAAGATAAEQGLALAVLERTADDLAHGLQTPSEVGFIADAFNFKMDAVIDAANGSAKMRTRVNRRAHMARAIDAADLVLLERGVVAAFIVKVRDLEAAIAAKQEEG